MEPGALPPPSSNTTAPTGLAADQEAGNPISFRGEPVRGFAPGAKHKHTILSEVKKKKERKKKRREKSEKKEGKEEK